MRNITYAVLILSFTLNLFGNVIVLRKPLKYNIPNKYNDFTVASKSERSEMQEWQAYCTLEGAETFTDLNSRRKFKTLNFFDKFYICEEAGEYVRLYKADDYNSSNFELSNEVDYGWVHKKDLLLSHHCFATDNRSINKKAMIVNRIEHLKANDSGDKANILAFRKGPGNNYENTGKESALFNFFFIYQKTIVSNAEWYLLGVSERFSDFKKKDIIYGWVPGYRMIEWDNNVVLEPNWEPEAVNERKNGIQAAFFNDPIALKKISRYR
ncbi:MAG: hypothetical protein JXR69_03240 [Candidatus Delongbacteria bacterium]|nr:hypothetical protein [Candidatus Delongbacteria bacterium]